MRDFDIPFIEDPSELGLNIDNLTFNKVQEVKTEKYKGKVYDLEIANLHNYHLDDIGIVHNGGGKRKGSFAVYIEPWHADIFEFLDMKKQTGKEELRARDLFYALWTPDLFMKQVEQDGDWYLMDPNTSPGLSDVHGEEFEKLYWQYVEEGKYEKKIRAHELWNKVTESQIETGTPYMLYKDSANEKSNQKNLGTIHSSNLCAEIIEHSDANESAVCNLASIGLPMFVDYKKGKEPKRKTKKINKENLEFDHELLYDVAYQATVNLNKVIDINMYPTPETERSNMRHRPIGLGVQGLADVFAKLGLPFDSIEAKQLNKDIFETIYFAALSASADIAKKDGTYETFEGSPASEGILQYHMWGLTEDNLSGRWDFTKLIKKIKKTGLRNSLLTALMPTASCFVSTGEIQTIDGNKSYRDIMSDNDINWAEIEKTNDQQWIEFKNPLKVNTRTGYKEADKIFYNGHVKTLKIEMEDGTVFECSENHKFLVKLNDEDVIWKRADELLETDEIVSF